MTPAVKILQKQKIEYQLQEYSTNDDSNNYGMQAAIALGQDPDRVFKTLLAVLDGDKKPVVAIIPVAKQLDLKKLASHFSARKAIMADPAVAQRVTGYLVGGISPIGQKQNLQTCIDLSVEKFATIFVSAGKRGLELELKPEDLINIISATTENISR